MARKVARIIDFKRFENRKSQYGTVIVLRGI